MPPPQPRFARSPKRDPGKVAGLYMPGVRRAESGTLLSGRGAGTGAQCSSAVRFFRLKFFSH